MSLMAHFASIDWSDWEEHVSPHTGHRSRSRSKDLGDGAVMTHQVSEQGGGLTIEHKDRIPGELHYSLVDAPRVDTGDRVPAVKVNWVEVQRNKGKGWASQMYQAVRDVHPDRVIPAADVLEAPGRRLVKHYRDKHPDVHVGRFDTDGRLHMTSDSDDPIYRPGILKGPSWKEGVKHFAGHAEGDFAFPYTADEKHADKRVHIRFGDWPADERSQNGVTGHPEEGVSTYDVSKHGEPLDPDPHWERQHEHAEHCEPDCDLDSWNEDYGNDSGDEMRGRMGEMHRTGNRYPHSRGHIVKGTFVGIGHDAEPLLQNVRKVGHYPCDIHKHVPGLEPVHAPWCEHPDHDED